MENDLRIKQKFVVDNPPGYREISKRRLVNQMWKFYSLQKKNLKAPLPQDEIDQIKALADRYIAASPKTPFQMKLEAELKERRLQTGKYLGRYNRISPRFMRRRYQTILSGHIPAISEIEGKWIVTTTRVHKAPHLPVVGRQHMGGYKLPDGTMGGEVDQNGVRSRSR